MAGQPIVQTSSSLCAPAVASGRHLEAGRSSPPAGVRSPHLQVVVVVLQRALEVRHGLVQLPLVEQHVHFVVLLLADDDPAQQNLPGNKTGTDAVLAVSRLSIEC